MLDHILEKYPKSELQKYGDWLELRFRAGEEAGCLKISGTKDQVIKQVNYFLNKDHEDSNNGSKNKPRR